MRKATAIRPVPHPSLVFDPAELGLKEYPRDFFRFDTVQVAREILGAWFARRHQDRWYGACIVETEAYLGGADAAAHSWRGRWTPRVEPMYMEGGHLYVFFVYGMHHCANVVTRQSGVPEAVLLRAAEGPRGTPPKLMSGPGRLCAALGITTEMSGQDLLSGGDLRLFRGSANRPEIGVSERVGVGYAGEAAHWPLRFFDRNSPAVSGPLHLKSKMRKPKPLQ
jgi:DNA-3-methyladenine glycosylase